MSHSLRHDIKALIALIEEKPPVRAFIREAECIGCLKCLEACPFDAIVGAQKKLHTVIESYCTGCQLCVEPCPVDCIAILPTARSDSATASLIEQSRVRFQLKKEREANYYQQQDEHYELAKKAFQSSENNNDIQAARRAEIEAAINRMKNK